LVAAIAAVTVLAPAWASAGGMSSFRFEDPYVVVGQTVTGRATFYTEARGTGRIENGPWHAYLIPEGGWIEPPDIPAAAVYLGPIAIEDGGHSRATASITFTVPDVTLGPYHLGLCNVPCTESFVGDLGGGWLSIARTDEGAALLQGLDRAEQDLRRVRYRLARRIRTAERPLENLTDRVDAMEGSIELRLAQMENRLQASLAEDRESSQTPWVMPLFGAVVVLAVLLLLRRGRRPSPDPVPQEPPVVEWEIPEKVSART
jgi:hypothetical protein